MQMCRIYGSFLVRVKYHSLITQIILFSLAVRVSLAGAVTCYIVTEVRKGNVRLHFMQLVCVMA